MKNFTNALIYIESKNQYQITTIDPNIIDTNDPSVLFVFDTSNINVAMKIMNNMNLAHLVNEMSSLVTL